LIEYRENKHRFFDDLLTMLNSLSSLLVTVEYLRLGYSNIANDTWWPFTLFSVIERKGLQFRPYALLKIMSEDNQWPARFIEFDEVPYDNRITDPAFVLSSPGFIRTTELISQSSFIRYFETLRPNVEIRFGDDPYQWPVAWNFARVIRNAFVHDSKIHFRNANAASITWKTQSYSPTDNGREIMGKDISHGDIIFLMAEMDASV
jgi:hypothetical protein